MEGSALLLLNGEPPSLPLFCKYYQPGTFLIAADGAANWLAEQNITADLILGDLDSLSTQSKEFFAKTPLIHTPDQNQTDAQKALSYLQEKGYQEIAILGGLGKRQDHQLYHYSLLLKFNSLQLKLIGEEDTSFLGSGKMELEAKAGKQISLIPLYGQVKVSSKGLAWELKNSLLEMGGLVSSSNQFQSGLVSLDIQQNPLLVIVEN